MLASKFNFYVVKQYTYTMFYIENSLNYILYKKPLEPIHFDYVGITPNFALRALKTNTDTGVCKSIGFPKSLRNVMTLRTIISYNSENFCCKCTHDF